MASGFGFRQGKYTFIVSAANEVMTRACQQDVLLYPDPSTMTVESTDIGLPLDLDVKVDTDELQLASVAYRGQIDGVGDVAPLHLSGTLAQASVQIPWPSPTESGHYRLNMVWVASTLDGREVVVEPPEVRFTLFDLPPVEPPPAVPPLRQEASFWRLTTWIGLVLGTPFIMAALAGIGLWWFRRRNTRALLSQQPETISSPEPEEPQPAVISNEDIDLNKRMTAAADRIGVTGGIVRERPNLAEIREKSGQK